MSCSRSSLRLDAKWILKNKVLQLTIFLELVEAHEELIAQRIFDLLTRNMLPLPRMRVLDYVPFGEPEIH